MLVSIRRWSIKSRFFGIGSLNRPPQTGCLGPENVFGPHELEILMLNWLDYRKKLVARIGDFASVSPETVKGYQTLSKAGEKTGHLDAKTRELIALAVSVTTRCDGCITVHAAEAVKLGASKNEVA